MLNELDESEKLLLMRFVCSFAWADLQITESEREFVANLAAKMELSEDATDEVMEWLDHPPAEEDLDPADIPESRRRLFLDLVLEMVAADGVIDTMEVESYAVLEALIAGEEMVEAALDPDSDVATELTEAHLGLSPETLGTTVHPMSPTPEA